MVPTLPVHLVHTKNYLYIYSAHKVPLGLKLCYAVLPDRTGSTWVAMLISRTNHVLATEHAHCVGGVSVMSVFSLCGYVGADVAMCKDDKGCVSVGVCVCGYVGVGVWGRCVCKRIGHVRVCVCDRPHII